MTKKYDKKSKEKNTEENNAGFTKYTNDQNIQINSKIVNLTDLDLNNAQKEEMKNVYKESCWLDITKDNSLLTNKRKKRKKIFFFIVDALRLDFMVNKKYEIRDEIEINLDDSDKTELRIKNEDEDSILISSSSSSSSSSPSSTSTSSSTFSPTSPYNKFKNMHELLRNNATQTLFFGFRADPPTVTSQRLKGRMPY